MDIKFLSEFITLIGKMAVEVGWHDICNLLGSAIGIPFCLKSDSWI